MEVGVSKPEVRAVPLRSQQDALSKALYDLGVILMYGGGVVSVAVYLANLGQVRALTATAEELEDELGEGELDEHAE